MPWEEHFKIVEKEERTFKVPFPLDWGSKKGGFEHPSLLYIGANTQKGKEIRDTNSFYFEIVTYGGEGVVSSCQTIHHSCLTLVRSKEGILLN